jgi:molybdenum cofactor guanylyltransferase
MFAAASAAFSLGILSGGAGTRLGGRDKGLVVLAGDLQVTRTASLVAGASEVLVSANRHLKEYRSLGFRVVADADGDFRGPLAGVAALLQASTQPWLLTLPVDLVSIPTDLPRMLMTLLGGTSVPLARVRDGDGLQPTVALYRGGLAASAAEALGRGERSLQRWQEAQGCVELRLDGSVGNRNEPRDYPPGTF